MPIKAPPKLYYTIGEVSRTTGLSASVLRFWETEFEGVRPPKNRSGKRLYRQVDIDRVLQIKKLLYENRYTIAGARQVLKDIRTSGNPSPEMLQGELLEKIPAEEIRQGLKEILALLSH